MSINSIYVKTDGYIHCRSMFYTSRDIIPECRTYKFSKGINVLRGGIDSGVWAVSYLLSMYKTNSNDFILNDHTEIVLDGENISLSELSKHTCYMDKSYSLFNTKFSVEDLINKGIKDSSLTLSYDEIVGLFCLNPDRMNKPLNSIGNEFWRASAAVGYCYNKKIFCFSWLTQRRFEYYRKQFEFLFEVLKELNVIVIVPLDKTGKPENGFSIETNYYLY